MNFIVFSILIISTLSRPIKTEKGIGYVDGKPNQHRYIYNSETLKQSRNKQNNDHIRYNYDVEFVDNFHSLDSDEMIEKIECTNDQLVIYSVSKDIEKWNNGDVMTGSEMWECQYSLTRKIVDIQFDGMEKELYKFVVSTENIEMNALFKKAKVKYENDKPLEKKEKDNRKTWGVSLDFVTPAENEYIVFSEDVVSFGFQISGVSQIFDLEAEITYNYKTPTTSGNDKFTTAAVSFNPQGSTNFQNYVDFNIASQKDTRKQAVSAQVTLIAKSENNKILAKKSRDFKCKKTNN